MEEAKVSSYQRRAAQIENVIEEIVIRLRHLLVPFYLLIPAVTVPRIFYDCFAMFTYRTMEESEVIATEHVMQGLIALDMMMVANLIILISQGSYYVFTRLFPYDQRLKPRTMSHLSSGLLKEKMASSAVGISSVVLIQIFINLSTKPEMFQLTHAQALGVQMGIHTLLLAGLLVFNHTNKADHQAHNAHSKGDDEPAKSGH